MRYDMAKANLDRHAAHAYLDRDEDRVTSARWRDASATGTNDLFAAGTGHLRKRWRMPRTTRGVPSLGMTWQRDGRLMQIMDPTARAPKMVFCRRSEYTQVKNWTTTPS
jgi:hypothetical protein